MAILRSWSEINTIQLGLHWFLERSGGADRLYADLIQRMPQYGVDCRGLVAGSSTVGQDSGGTVRAFAPPEASFVRRWRAARACFVDAANESPPDLVASHFAFYTLPTLSTCRKQKLPLAVHFHGPWAGESKAEGAGRVIAAAKMRVERSVYQQAKRLIVLSNAFGDILVRNYGVDRERVRVVRPGIDTQRFQTNVGRAAARERLGWPGDRPIVLAVRRLVQRMGLENLIDATTLLKKTVPGVLVLIAGKGPLTASLEEQIRTAGLEEHVRLLGFVSDDDLPTAYAGADITVVPTVALEGFGLIVVESLAAGTPVLVTPVGGLPEAVRDLSPELIMPDASVESIARTLADAFQGRIQLPSKSACESFASRVYDWSVIGPQIRTVYEEAIAER